MPEGPEIRRAADALGRVLTRRTLIHIEYRIPRLARKARALRGAKVKRVYTRGKALLIEFDRGLTHFSHNQLYGEWEVTAGARTQDERRTVRVVLATAKHTATLYSATDIDLLDTRKVDRHPYLARLGPDVLDPATTVASIEARLVGPALRRAVAREPAPRPALRRRSRQLPAQRHPVHGGPYARRAAA